MPFSPTIHATAVCLPSYRAPFVVDEASADCAVVLRGPSGSGKSDLALRLIARYGARLIADDQVAVREDNGQVLCAAPAAIAGLLEVRGLGLLAVGAHPGAAAALVVDLVAREAVTRLPGDETAVLCNITLPCLRLHAFDDSTPDKIIAALAVVKRPELVIR